MKKILEVFGIEDNKLDFNILVLIKLFFVISGFLVVCWDER